MSDRYQLMGLSNGQLLANLSRIVKCERELVSEQLAYLAELDTRQMYLELGYPSLFAFCTERLGFCKSAAGRRIAAARVCRTYPSVFARVASGQLRVSVLSILKPYLTAENAVELFDACSGKTFEQVELLLAARFPRPDVRDTIRRLPESAPPVMTSLPARASASADGEEAETSTGDSPIGSDEKAALPPRSVASEAHPKSQS
jgi:hypothetical protein